MYALTEPSTDARTQLETDGYTLLRGALAPEDVADIRMAVDDVWRRHRDEAPQRGAAPLHLLAFLNEDRRFLDLVDHPRALRTVVDVLGPNIFMYHCHLDVHRGEAPRIAGCGTRTAGSRTGISKPIPVLGSPSRSRTSSRIFGPEPRNFLVVPGCTSTAIRRRTTACREPSDPRRPGDAVVFDRRLWHMRSQPLRSRPQALFFAYTYRWIRPRDDMVGPHHRQRLTPAQLQLVGLDDASPSIVGCPTTEATVARAVGDARP